MGPSAERLVFGCCRRAQLLAASNRAAVVMISGVLSIPCGGAGIRSDADIFQNARNLEEVSLVAKTDTESIEINVWLGNGLCS